MPKNILFTFVEGTLIYRNAGRVYKKPYTVKGHIVYNEKGRKIGTVGKPRTARQKRIAERAGKRIRKRREKELSSEIIEDERPRSLSLQDLADIGRTRSPEERGLYNVYQTELYNLAEILQESIDKGALTQEEGQMLLDAWLDATTIEERNKVWTQVSALFEEKGYVYL